MPDAALFFADRFVAVDHLEGNTYAVALISTAQEERAATAWLDAMQSQAAELPPVAAAGAHPHVAPAPVWEGSASDAPRGQFMLRRSRHEYMADVESSLEAIRSGETYEVCLTTSLDREQGAVTPRALYGALRQCNPAPYAAWLRFGGGAADNATICCSSPERFLRIDRQAREAMLAPVCAA